MTIACPGCGAALNATDPACRLCGAVASAASAVDVRAEAGAGDGRVLEPEVLESLAAAERSAESGSQTAFRPVGCTLGPGCGCIGLPLAALAGAVVSALMVVLWLLSLGRVPVSIFRLAQRLRQRSSRG